MKKLKPETSQERMDVANAALSIFCPDTRLLIDGGYAKVKYDRYDSHSFTWRWQTRGQDFYPVWYRKWAHGGTRCTALSQLVRWVQGKPVLPISTWEYWCSETVKLAPDNGELLATLRAGGYPEHATCIFCGKTPIGRFDWFNIGGKSGPGCWYDNKECTRGSR